MTILFTGTGGLFTRLGAIGNYISDINVFQSSPCPDDTQQIVEQYPDNNDLAMIDGIETQTSAEQSAAGSIMSTLQQYATNTVNTMVYQDDPLLSNTNIQASLIEVIKQMEANNETIQECVITETTVPVGGNHGDGVCVCSIYRRDGFIQENTFAEKITTACSQDSTSSASLAGQENFSVSGVVSYTNFDWRFPGGSGAQITLSAIDASQDNSAGNLLTNSDFETFASNIPSSWTVLVGTPGTTIKQYTVDPYTGDGTLEFVGNGAQLTSIAQTFDDETSGTVSSLTQYACSVWVKVSAVPSTGVLQIALLDETNTVIDDEQGNANSFTINLTTATTSWVNYTGVFRTPYILPTTVKLAVRLTTAVENAKSVYIDHLGMGSMSLLYAGGPSFAVFSGADNFYIPDSFTSEMTNDRGGASENRTFQCLFQRLFNTPGLGLLLPSDGSPTIPDNLIS